MKNEKPEKPKRPVIVIPRSEIEKEAEENRSIDIQMMRSLMRRYKDQAKDEARRLFGFPLTKEEL